MPIVSVDVVSICNASPQCLSVIRRRCVGSLDGREGRRCERLSLRNRMDRSIQPDSCFHHVMTPAGNGS